MEPKLVGIVNVTPDSFSDGGAFFDPEDAIKHAHELFEAGASFIDVGAESTRPGATPLSIVEEQRRLFPVVNAYASLFNEMLSIDTYHPETIEWIASEIGPVIINDVTGFNNPRMIEIAAEFNLPCIVSHLPRKYGQSIQEAHGAPEKVDSMQQVVDEQMSKREEMMTAGIDEQLIWLDPGIGFGKTRRLSWELLKNYPRITGVNELMAGYSNKSFLASDPETGALLPNATDLRNDEVWLRTRNLFAADIARTAGYTMLRVHDVAAHAQWLSQSTASE